MAKKRADINGKDHNWKFAGFFIGILSLVLWFMTSIGIQNQKFPANLYFPALVIEWILPSFTTYIILKGPERARFLSGQSAAFVIGICIMVLYGLGAS